MAHAKDDSHAGNHAEGQQKRGAFTKVKDKLDFTKHLGFQSSPDSMANRQALENYRARQAREAEEQRHGQENEKDLGPGDGIGGIAETLAGTVAPKSENTLGVSSKAPAERQGEQNHGDKPIEFDESLPHSPQSREPKPSSEEHVEQKDQGKGWGHWATHKLHQVARAAASKDLSDDLLKKDKEAKAKHTK
ncbi:hypothetical protein R1flu_011496 [Riccia fluitans]|uniref:Uncharacterized protein n=1 Tax=Riccia fluitans TaxID=41844 RepID=A0ABD1ZAK5_9MARC